MKKRSLILCLALSACLLATACSSETSNTSSEDTSISTSDVSNNSTESSPVATSEKITTEITTEEITTEEQKQYDVYVNGKGFDKGATVNFKLSLKANDTQFVRCCPSVNIACEGVSNPEDICNSVEYDETDTNPLLISNNGSDDFNQEYYSFWGYYELLARWNAPDAPPLDITDGIYVYTARITFNEPGNYTVNVTSGNGYEEMAEEFAKYDNCFTLEIIE